MIYLQVNALGEWIIEKRQNEFVNKAQLDFYVLLIFC